MMFKKYRTAVVACTLAAIFVGSASDARASIQTGDIIRLADGPGAPGGVFFVQDTAGNKLIDTFCVQLEEFVSFSRTYLVTNHMATSTAGAGSRSLTSFAAWLYDRYLNGVEGVGPVLPNFDFANKYGETNMNAARFQANELQLAIWRAMGYTPEEIGGVIGGWYDTYDGKYEGWETAFNNDAQWSGTGNIYILNLLGQNNAGNYTVHAQDQLVRIVPEPLSIAVWSMLGLALFGARRLRRPLS